MNSRWISLVYKRWPNRPLVTCTIASSLTVFSLGLILPLFRQTQKYGLDYIDRVKHIVINFQKLERSFEYNRSAENQFVHLFSTFTNI